MVVEEADVEVEAEDAGVVVDEDVEVTGIKETAGLQRRHPPSQSGMK